MVIVHNVYHLQVHSTIRQTTGSLRKCSDVPTMDMLYM